MPRYYPPTVKFIISRGTSRPTPVPAGAGGLPTGSTYGSSYIVDGETLNNVLLKSKKMFRRMCPSCGVLAESVLLLLPLDNEHEVFPITEIVCESCADAAVLAYKKEGKFPRLWALENMPLNILNAY